VSGEAVGANEPGSVRASEQALWLAWRQGGDAAARERLIHLHLEFARILAGKLYARRPTNDVEFAEYVQLASLGLIEAVDRYDPGQGASFRTYASHRIQGAILSGLEASTERARQLALKRRIEQERLQSLRGGAEPATGDAFSRLASIAVGLAIGFMLDDVASFRAEDAAYGDNAYAASELRRLHGRLLSFIDELPERESKIIRSHYLQQMPFDDIAKSLKLTPGRVSQLHGRALGQLRAWLGDGAIDIAL
jgi:RNA polymerase sigma factor for flagellar operon FliA